MVRNLMNKVKGKMIVSGSYTAFIDDSEEPELSLQFTGFSSVKEVDYFLEWLDTVLLDPFSGLDESLKH